MPAHKPDTLSRCSSLNQISRRPFLVALGVGGVSIAGCIGDGDSETDADDTDDHDDSEPSGDTEEIDDADDSADADIHDESAAADDDQQEDSDDEEADDDADADDTTETADEEEEEQSYEDLMTFNLNEEGLSDGDDIGPYLAEFVGTGRDIIIEPGEYEWNTHRTERLVMSRGTIVGQGDWGDVVISLDADDSSGNRFQPVFYTESGDALIKNLKFVGLIGYEDGSEKINVAARAADDQIVLERVGLVDGVVHGSGAGGMYTHSSNLGSHRFEHCVSHYAADNGMYMDGGGSSHFGPVEFIGGYYKNSNISDIRIGGDDAHVQGVTVVHDDDDRWDSSRRPLRFRQLGDNMLIEDSDFYITQADGMLAVFNFARRAEFTGGTIRNCRVYNETDAPIVNGDRVDPDDDWFIDNLHLTGSGNHELGESDGVEYGEIFYGDEAEKASPEPRTPIGTRGWDDVDHPGERVD